MKGSTSDRTPSTSLSPIAAYTPAMRANPKEDSTASRRVAAPAGLCAASTMIVGE